MVEVENNVIIIVPPSFPPESEAQSPWHRVDPLLGSSIGTMSLGSGDDRRQLLGYGSLVITDALPTDTGFYRCMWAGREYATYHLQVARTEPYTMVSRTNETFSYLPNIVPMTAFLMLTEVNVIYRIMI